MPMCCSSTPMLGGDFFRLQQQTFGCKAYARYMPGLGTQGNGYGVRVEGVSQGNGYGVRIEGHEPEYPARRWAKNCM